MKLGSVEPQKKTGSEGGKFEPVPNGYYETVVTDLRYCSGIGEYGPYEFLGITLKVRDDVEQKYKNRYISGMIRVTKKEFEAGTQLTDYFDSKFFCYVKDRLTDKEKAKIAKAADDDWLTVKECIVNKFVKVKVTNKVNDDGTFRTKVNKKTGEVEYADPYLDFYVGADVASSPAFDTDDLPF